MTAKEKELADALDKYIKEMHTQEECIGFIAGWEARDVRVIELEKEKQEDFIVSAKQREKNRQLEIELKGLRDELAYYKRKTNL